MATTVRHEASSVPSTVPSDWSASRANDASHALHARLSAVFELEHDDSRRVRLSLADTSVTFTVRGASVPGVTLLLDRETPVVTDGSEPAEVGIELSPEHAREYMDGGMSLGPVLLAGDAGYRGPIRKFLMVDAVVRSLLRS